jgi:hypothetical protein
LGLACRLAIYVLLQVGMTWPIATRILALGHIAAGYALRRATVKLSRNLTLAQLRGALVRPARNEMHGAHVRPLLLCRNAQAA